MGGGGSKHCYTPPYPQPESGLSISPRDPPTHTGKRGGAGEEPSITRRLARSGAPSGECINTCGSGACGPSGAFGTQGLLMPVPLTTNCWPEAP